jgi:uncharacterized phage protein (TIGR01671 family)
MQDRYLFKAKRKDDGEWVFGGLSYCEKTNAYFITNMGKDHISYIGFHQEVDSNTICQCTGLKDKNGNLIWENDIVSCKHEKYIGTDVLDSKMHRYTRNYAIEFENTFCNYGLRFRNKSIHFRCTQATLCMHDCEVLGNVFDNPELLEE